MKPIVPVSARGERSPSGRDQTRLTGLDVMRGEEEERGQEMRKEKDEEAGKKERREIKEEVEKEEGCEEIKGVQRRNKVGNDKGKVNVGQREERKMQERRRDERM